MKKQQIGKMGVGVSLLLALYAGSALGTDYYIRDPAGDPTAASDTYDGTAPIWDGATLVGPKETLGAGVVLADVAAGNILHLSAGTFLSNVFPTGATTWTVTISNRTDLIGAGSGSTSYLITPTWGTGDSLGGSAIFTCAPGTLADPVVIKGFSVGLQSTQPTLTVGGIRFTSANTGYATLEDLVFSNYAANNTNGFLSANIGAGVGRTWDKMLFKNVTIQNVTGTFLKPGNSSSNVMFNDWTFENTSISGTGTWMTAGRLAGFNNLTATNFTFDSNAQGFTMVKTLGNTTIDGSSFQDNTGTGLAMGTLDTGPVVIKNSTIRDTASGNAQTTGVSMSIPDALTIGDLVFDNVTFGGAGTTSISIVDNNTTAGSTHQTRPIELKNVSFADATYGLYITGSGAADLWYIDPAQSNATISGGTLITGGRMTYYGDANLDGTVDDTDKTITQTNQGQYGLGWGGGDYNRDGVTDALDLVWFITAVLGDLNNDSIVNNQDIAPFVLALTDLPSWQAAYPGVDILAVGDINNDAAFNNQDIAPFVTLLTGSGTSLGGETSTVPEPASLGLLAIGSLMLISRRRRA